MYDKLEMSKARRAFVAWVHEQPDEATYEFQSIQKCAVGQFLTAMGLEANSSWMYYPATHQGNNRTHDLVQGSWAATSPRTFGGLKTFMKNNAEAWV